MRLVAPRFRLASMFVVAFVVSVAACADEDLVPTVPPTAVPIRSSVGEASQVQPTQMYIRAMDEAMRRASNDPDAGSEIAVEAVRDALLRDPESLASRALAVCGSPWRPAEPPLGALESSGTPNEFRLFRIELPGVLYRSATSGPPDGAPGPTTTGAFFHAILEASPSTAAELGVTPEAYLECLEAALAEAPEA